MKTIHHPSLHNQLYLSGAVYVGQGSATYVSQLNTKKIAAGQYSPAVSYREQVSVLTVDGCIASEEAVATMNKTMGRVDTHLAAHEGLSLVMGISRINTSGVKMLMNLLNRLKNYIAKGKEVEVVWVLSESDEELIDMAADLINLYGINIDMRIR